MTIVVIVCGAIILAFVGYSIAVHSAGEPEGAEEDRRLSEPVQMMDPFSDEPLVESGSEEISVETHHGTLRLHVNPRTAAVYRQRGLAPFKDRLIRLLNRRVYYCYRTGEVGLELLDYYTLHYLLFGLENDGVALSFDEAFDIAQHAWEATHSVQHEDVLLDFESAIGTDDEFSDWFRDDSGQQEPYDAVSYFEPHGSTRQESAQ